MKSIQQLAQKLARQWLSADCREQRLLLFCDWPIRMSIGKPNAKEFTGQSVKVQHHLSQWRKQKIGRVEWASVKYQSASEPFDVPINWLIDSPEDWIIASADLQTKAEYKQLIELIEKIDPIFHQLIVRHRSLWANKNGANIESITRCCQLAMLLASGMAMGRPLRALSIAGFDSKFLENQRGLLTQLLNIRFAGALKDQNLEKFLGASEKGEHWLLLKPLAKGILPFEQLRLRASELSQIDLPVQNLIIVENEQCHHQLPELENTLSILGSGLDLIWLENPHFKNKTVFYWGDIDTWGLKMLAMARGYQPQLQALLMDCDTYNNHQQLAVPEPTVASTEIPQGLTTEEAKLYQKLLHSANGRLEQERLPEAVVQAHIRGLLHKNSG